MRTNRINVLTLVLATVLLSSCASVKTRNWQETTKASIVASAQLYDATMTAVGQLYQAGALGKTPAENERAWGKAVQWANVYRAAGLGSLAALEINDREELDRNMADMANAVIMISKLIKGD